MADPREVFDAIEGAHEWRRMPNEPGKFPNGDLFECRKCKMIYTDRTATMPCVTEQEA